MAGVLVLQGPSLEDFVVPHKLTGSSAVFPTVAVFSTLAVVYNSVKVLDIVSTMVLHVLLLVGAPTADPIVTACKCASAICACTCTAVLSNLVPACGFSLWNASIVLRSNLIQLL